MIDKFLKIYKLLLPKSHAFSLFVDNNMRKFFVSLSALPADFRNYINSIYLDLFPSTTRSLELWNKTFGITKKNSTSGDLSSAWLATGGQSPYYLENLLRSAGFDVQVHINEPAIDPALLLNYVPIMFCGSSNSYAGYEGSVCGFTGGELLVNGPVYTNIPAYLSQCGGDTMVCGNDLAIVGYFEEVKTQDKIYTLPTESWQWPAVFFVGGDATRDPNTHKIIEIENAMIPSNKKDDIKKMIIKYKPAQTWVGLFADYI